MCIDEGESPTILLVGLDQIERDEEDESPLTLTIYNYLSLHHYYTWSVLELGEVDFMLV